MSESLMSCFILHFFSCCENARVWCWRYLFSSLGYTYAKIMKKFNYICCSLWDYTNVVMSFLCERRPLDGSVTSSFDWLQYFDVVITGRSCYFLCYYNLICFVHTFASSLSSFLSYFMMWRWALGCIYYSWWFLTFSLLCVKHLTIFLQSIMLTLTWFNSEEVLLHSIHPVKTKLIS